MEYIEDYNNFNMNENLKDHKYINKIYNYLLSDSMKDKTKDFLLKCKNEIGEYKEVGQILVKATTDKKITREERKKVYEQLVDTLKIGGTGALFLLPFGSVLIYGLVKIGNKLGINFLPSSWKKTNEGYVSIEDEKYFVNILTDDINKKYLKDVNDFEMHVIDFYYNAENKDIYKGSSYFRALEWCRDDIDYSYDLIMKEKNRREAKSKSSDFNL